MLYRIAISFVAIVFIASCQSDGLIIDNPVKDDYLEEKYWFEYMCSDKLGGRYSGSEGINAAKDYICGMIGESDSLYVDTFLTSKCIMNNIVFHVDGEIDSTIVLGAHYDAYGYYNNTPLPGADDNLSGVVVLLKVIKAIQTETIHPKYGIDICFFDGEEIGRYGSTRFVSVCTKGIKQYINIDTIGNPDIELAFYYSIGCSYLMEGFVGLIDKLNMYTGEYSPENYITDCDSFKYQHVPFICMVCKTLPSYLHSLSDDVSHISFERLDIIARGIERYLRLL